MSLYYDAAIAECSWKATTYTKDVQLDALQACFTVASIASLCKIRVNLAARTAIKELTQGSAITPIFESSGISNLN
jgi:hypothetical protein